MRNYKAADVDEFINNAPAEAQPKLRELRAAVKSAVPEAEESISWGVPFYKYHGLLAGFTAVKDHVDFGLAFYIDDAIRRKLKKISIDTGLKTIKIRFDQPLPVSEIKELLVARAKENLAKKG